MRRVDAIIPVGAYPPGSTARLWVSDANGVLITSGPWLADAIKAPEEDPRWLEQQWFGGPWLASVDYAGWLNSVWLAQAWLEEVKLIELPGPLYEEGVVAFGVSIGDRFGSESTSPPSSTAKLYVNDSPARLNKVALGVASDIVTLTIASEAELTPT